MTDKDTPSMREMMELRTALDERDREIAKLKGENAKINEQLTGTAGQLKTAKNHIKLSEYAGKMGVLPGAIQDVVYRAMSAGQWDSDPKGNFRLKDEHGFFSDTPEEFIRKVKQELPSYFLDAELTENLSSSEGSRGSSRKSLNLDGVVYTYEQLRTFFKDKKEGGNFTKACLVHKNDPELAAQLAEETNNKIFKVAQEQDRRFGR